MRNGGGMVQCMWFLNWGRRPRAIAGGLVAFGVVLLLTAREVGDWRALTFLGVSLIVPSLVWLVGDHRGERPQGALWWVVLGLAVALGVWGLALFPAADQTPFHGVR